MTARSDLASLKRSSKRTIAALEAKIAVMEPRSELFGLNLPSIRDALCKDRKAAKRPWCPFLLGVLGDGPWLEDDFKQFIRKRGFEPIALPNPVSDGLVVGMNGWSAEVLSDQIHDRDPNSLRIYTQELFVIGLILKKDPYDVLEQEVIEEVAECHPAIQFILKQGFLWPWKVEAPQPVYRNFRDPMVPSAALAAIVGSKPLSRSDAGRGLWGYIKIHKLQDTVDRRMINADEKLEKFFGKPQVSMFEMATLLNRHLK